MITDISLQMAALTNPTATGTTYSNVLDTGALQDWGMGANWIWEIDIPGSQGFTSGGAGTIDWQLQVNNTDPTFAGGTTTVLIDTGVLALAVLAAQTLRFLRIPRGTVWRYARVATIVATAAMTAGGFISRIATDTGVQDNRTSANGYTVA